MIDEATLKMVDAEELQELALAGIAGAQIPKRFRDLELGTHPQKELAEELAENAEGSWYFYGPSGVGKTGLAVGAAKSRLRRGRIEGERPLLFRSVPNLLTELRGTIGRSDGPSDPELMHLYSSVGILILDDVGMESDSGSGWMQDKLYQIIGNRHGEMLSTYFTGNLDLPQLRTKWGEKGEALVTRIAEACGKNHVVPVTGANLRIA